jgi:hypothetical protein
MHCVTVQLFQTGSGTVEIVPVAGAEKISANRVAGAAGGVTAAEAGAGCAAATPARARMATNARTHVAFDISLLMRSARLPCRELLLKLYHGRRAQPAENF